MSFVRDERKSIITKLQETTIEPETSEQNLIEFLHKYYLSCYDDFFEMLNKARTDNVRYQYQLLEKYMSDRFNINPSYVDLGVIKVIIFYENILKYLDGEKEEDEERKKVIRERKDLFNLYLALISNEKYSISKFPKLNEIFSGHKMTQKDFDDDYQRNLHENLAGQIYNSCLIAFIEEYKNYL